MKRTGPSNPNLVDLIKLAKKAAIEHKSPFWKRIAEELEMPTRKRRSVNLYRINKFSSPDETVIIPGKVLSTGDLDKKLTIVALSFSKVAQEKIESAKGKTLSVREFLTKNPQGKGARIIG